MLNIPSPPFFIAFTLHLLLESFVPSSGCQFMLQLTVLTLVNINIIAS